MAWRLSTEKEGGKVRYLPPQRALTDWSWATSLAGFLRATPTRTVKISSGETGLSGTDTAAAAAAGGVAAATGACTGTGTGAAAGAGVAVWRAAEVDDGAISSSEGL